MKKNIGRIVAPGAERLLAKRAYAEFDISNKEIKTFTTCCNNCGTIFTFEKEDITSNSICAKVNCAACKEKIQINSYYKKFVNEKKPKLGCEYSHFEESEGYKCSVTSDRCMFIYPNAEACKDKYEEGPLATNEEFSKLNNINSLCKEFISINNRFEIDMNKFNEKLKIAIPKKKQREIIMRILIKENSCLNNKDESRELIFEKKIFKNTQSGFFKEFITFFSIDITTECDGYCAIKWDENTFK